MRYECPRCGSDDIGFAGQHLGGCGYCRYIGEFRNIEPEEDEEEDEE